MKNFAVLKLNFFKLYNVYLKKTMVNGNCKLNLKITEQQTNNNYSSIPSAYLQSVARRRRTTAAQRPRRRRSTSSTWPRKGSSATNARVFMFLDFCQLLLLPLYASSQTSLLLACILCLFASLVKTL